MKVVLYIYDDVPLSDFVVPYELLRGIEGVVVEVVSQEVGVVKVGGQALSVVTKHALCDVSDADVLWVCGGRFGVGAQCDNPDVKHHLYRLSQSATAVVGVASGALLLAEAGVLKDVKGTGFFEHRRQLKKLGVQLEKQAVVLDGKVITADSHGHTFALTFSLVQLLFDDGRSEALKEAYNYIPEYLFSEKQLPHVGYKANQLHQVLCAPEKRQFKQLSASKKSIQKHTYDVTFYLFDEMRALDFAVIYDMMRHFPSTKINCVADRRGLIAIEGNGFSVQAPRAIQEITKTNFMVIGGGENGVITEVTHAYLMHWLLKICPTAERILTIADGVRYLGVSGILTEYESYMDMSQPLTTCKFMMAPCLTMAMDAVLELAQKHHGDKFAKSLQRFVAYGYKH